MIIIVKWCSDIAYDWCASLDIAYILALSCQTVPCACVVGPRMCCSPA